MRSIHTPNKYEIQLMASVAEITDRYYEALECAFILYLTLLEVVSGNTFNEVQAVIEASQEYCPNWKQYGNDKRTLLQHLESFSENLKNKDVKK